MSSTGWKWLCVCVADSQATGLGSLVGEKEEQDVYETTLYLPLNLSMNLNLL